MTCQGNKDNLELVICRGLQASGKTTFARAWVAEDPAHRFRVNRDDLRDMADEGRYIKGVTEGRILAARDALIERLLKRGISVICDDTNLPKRTVRDLAKIAVRCGVSWRVEDTFLLESLGTCLYRNRIRNQILITKGQQPKLPDTVIEDTYHRFIQGKVMPLDVPTMDEVAGTDKTPTRKYIPPAGKPWAILVDIDGTVAEKGTRGPFDEDRVHEDTPKQDVIEIVQSWQELGYKVIFMSGRTAGCRIATARWLIEHVGNYTELHMRPVGDNRKDSIVKAELFDQHVRDNYRIKFVLDDRNQVVAMWRAMGLLCLQVAEGNF